MIKKIFLVAALMTMSACAVIGIQPKTFNERLAAAYSTVTAIRETSIVLLNAGELTANDAQNVQNQANGIRQALDVSDALYKVKPDNGEEKLVATLRMLRVLEAYVGDKK